MMIAFSLLAALQDDLRVMRPDEKPGPLLYDRLRAECKERFDARREAVAALKTPEDVRRRQEDLRKKFLEALGGLPERTPLNAKVVGELKGAGFRVEKVIYESRPGHHVTAALYLPDGPGPFPGVLVPCGHSDNGKAAEAYQRASILFAKSGCAALCYDPISQGERRQILDAEGKPVGKGNTTEHTMIGIGALLVGECAATYRIWDGLRSLDYLAGRPEVDAKRLGCAGNSGGGTMTSYLMALDERIAAAAPSCYITTLERLFETIGPQDAEQNIPGQVAFGMEHADYVTMRAPRPTLINVGTRDYFDITGAKTTFREAKGIYRVMGREEAVELFEFDDKHGWSKPRRESAARWMRRWLLDDPKPVLEPEFPIFSDAEMRCTTSGQALADLKGRSVFDFIADRAKAAKRAAPTKEIVRERLAPRPATSKTVSRDSVARDGIEIHRRVVEVDGLTMPELVYRGKKGGPVVLLVHGGGKAKAHERAMSLAKEGATVVAPDLPGWGETALHPGGKPFGPDWKESALSLHLARPLLGRRVAALLDAIEREGVTRLIGIGGAGPAVLHAAFLSGREVEIEDALVSWASVVAMPVTEDQYSNAVPGVLLSYDLPELAAAAKATIRRPVDAAGKPLPE